MTFPARISGSSLVRALAKAMTMAPLSAIAIAGIEPHTQALPLRCSTRCAFGAPSESAAAKPPHQAGEFHSDMLVLAVTLLAAAHGGSTASSIISWRMVRATVLLRIGKVVQ